MVRRTSDKRAFTLVEMLIVTFIIGILLAIALPSFLNNTEAFEDAKAKYQLAIASKELTLQYIIDSGYDEDTVDAVRSSEPQLFIINNDSYSDSIVAIDLQSDNKAILRTLSSAGNRFCIVQSEGAEAAVQRSWETGTVLADCNINTYNEESSDLFYSAAAFSLADLLLANNAEIVGNALTNNDITINNSAQICGNATAGPGGTIEQAQDDSICDGYTTANLEAIEVPEEIDSSQALADNLNHRICNQDPCSGSVTYNFSSKTLLLDQQDSLFLQGTGDYYFCSIELNGNSSLVIDDEADVRVYIGDPGDCSGPGSGNIEVNNKAKIVNLNSQATPFTVCMEGSNGIDTHTNIDNSFQASTVMALYAPRSSVTLDNKTTVIGAILAKQITMFNHSQIVYDPSVTEVSC